MNRVFADKPPVGRIVVPEAVVIEAGFRIEFPSCVAEAVHDAAGRGHEIAERVVVLKQTGIGKTESWAVKGGYSFPNLNVELEKILHPYKIQSR